MIAVQNKNVEAVKILAPLEADNMDDDGKGPLEYAEGQTQIIEILQAALGIAEESGENVDGLCAVCQ